MPTYSVTLESSPDLADLRSADLWDLGAAGVEVRDAELTPMPGHAPPRDRAVLVGWFTHRESATAAAAALGGQVAEVADQDWGESWKRGLEPLSIGRVWVRPSWIETPAPAGAAEVILDPGMAFGTGTHPTTALCLAALSDLLGARPAATVLDVGTGSGLLAIAARKLGAREVRANDNDPVAVEVARENAARNGAAVTIGVEPLGEIPGRFDLVVANILANTLVELAPELAAHVAPGGVAIVSGILVPQEDEVRAAYAAAGLAPLPAQDRRDGEWSLLAFARDPA
ncbi:MAG TPA: 50S ribosomal protein L11 methyltransferase [Anaeromyxobacter sp.]|nr:50S ribosomal protein L11 methyltransferase [Anaeromyxobacter sp.]